MALVKGPFCFFMDGNVCVLHMFYIDRFVDLGFLPCSATTTQEGWCTATFKALEIVSELRYQYRHRRAASSSSRHRLRFIKNYLMISSPPRPRSSLPARDYSFHSRSLPPQSHSGPLHSAFYHHLHHLPPNLHRLSPSLPPSPSPRS